MQPTRKLVRVDTAEVKAQLVRKLGHQRAELYFHSLKKFLGFQLSKSEFDKICVTSLGKENIKLHNFLVRSILGNAYMSLGPPPSRQTPAGNSQTSSVTNGPLASGVSLAKRGVRPLGNRDRRFGDKPSPLGKSPLGHPGAGELASVEDGEEVDQARGSPVCVQSKSPIRAPLGLPKVQNSKPSISSPSDVCYNNGELPDTEYLLKLLQNKLKAEGLSTTLECAHLLNSGLNANISQLLKSSLGVAKARGNTMRTLKASGSAAINGGQNNGLASDSGSSYQTSVLDLCTAVQSNTRLLGCDYAKLYEKISSHLDS